MSSRTRRFATIGLALFAALWIDAAAAMAAPAEAAGKVTITQPASSARITRGGSSTPFTMRLPDNASCPGDSADDDYRVQSFLVPDGVDPGTVRYKSQGPDVPNAWAVYKVTTSAYIQEQTADAKEMGDPGPILALPALFFGVFDGALLPGKYHMGVACSLYNETVKYWATDIEFKADPGDEPAGVRWLLPGAEASSSGSPFMALIALAVVVVAGGAIFVAARRGAAARQGA